MRPSPTSPTLVAMTLGAPRGLLCRSEVPVALGRRHHQEAVALLDDALDVAGLHVRMADDHVVLLAGLDHAGHPLQQFGMLVLPRDAKLLAEVAFANEDGADALYLGQHGVEVLDPT